MAFLSPLMYHIVYFSLLCFNSEILHIYMKGPPSSPSPLKIPPPPKDSPFFPSLELYTPCFILL